MTDPTSLIQQAQALIREHQPQAARRILQSVLRLEPANEAAWWCYIETFNRRRDRLAVLEAFAREFPKHPRLGRLLQRLREADGAGRMADTRPIAEEHAAPGKPGGNQARLVLGYLTWAILACCLLCLVVSGTLAYRAYGDLEQRFNILTNQYLILDQSFKDLSELYGGLLQEFDRLNKTYIGLQNEYHYLEELYTFLQMDYASLKTTYDQLAIDYRDLETGYNDLAESYLTLDRQAIKPPYIYIHQREIVMAFFRDDGEFLYWNIPFESLEEAIELGYETRANPVTLPFQTNHGVQFEMQDYRVYVQPDPFRDVIAELYYQSPGDEAFIRQVWGIVTQLAIWTEEFGDIPRYPLEVLLAGGGDCEDLSILFASMIKAAPVDWQVDLVLMDTRSQSDPQSVDHMIVRVNTGDKNYLIETSSNQEMLPYTGKFSGWYLGLE
jgi:hypothetical protein